MSVQEFILSIALITQPTNRPTSQPVSLLLFSSFGCEWAVLFDILGISFFQNYNRPFNFNHSGGFFSTQEHNNKKLHPLTHLARMLHVFFRFERSDFGNWFLRRPTFRRFHVSHFACGFFSLSILWPYFSQHVYPFFIFFLFFLAFFGRGIRNFLAFFSSRSLAPSLPHTLWLSFLLPRWKFHPLFLEHLGHVCLTFVLAAFLISKQELKLFFDTLLSHTSLTSIIMLGQARKSRSTIEPEFDFLLCTTKEHFVKIYTLNIYSVDSPHTQIHLHQTHGLNECLAWSFNFFRSIQESLWNCFFTLPLSVLFN